MRAYVSESDEPAQQPARSFSLSAEGWVDAPLSRTRICAPDSALAVHQGDDRARSVAEAAASGARPAGSARRRTLLRGECPALLVRECIQHLSICWCPNGHDVPLFAPVLQHDPPDPTVMMARVPMLRWPPAGTGEPPGGWNGGDFIDALRELAPVSPET